MKKAFILFMSIFTILLAGCGNNQQYKKAEEVLYNEVTINNNNNKQEKKSVIVYIDKNCQEANIPQCNKETLKQYVGFLLGTGDDLKIEYLTGEKLKEIKEKVGISPVLVFGEKELDKITGVIPNIKKEIKKIDDKNYLPLYGWMIGDENVCNDGKDNNNDGKIDKDDPTCKEMVVLTSEKCKEDYCMPEVIYDVFKGYHMEIIDYKTETGTKLYKALKEKNGAQYLPTFLFNKKNKYIEHFSDYIKDLSGVVEEYKYQIDVPGFEYDPSIEICETDCNASDTCKELLTCNKSDKPVVELFVMSHCPFGTQAQKGILPVIKLLKDKIDFYVRFVNYIMHDKKEIDENTVQHCIQQEQPDKYSDYLECFLEKGDTQGCLDKVGINKNKLDACIKKTDEQYNITKNYDDKSSWISGRFPKYEVDNELNEKYGIQGSPTLVINGIVVQTGRSPNDYLKAICEAFKNPPEECKKELLSQPYDPGFGWNNENNKETKDIQDGSCGE